MLIAQLNSFAKISLKTACFVYFLTDLCATFIIMRQSNIGA